MSDEAKAAAERAAAPTAPAQVDEAGAGEAHRLVLITGPSGAGRSTAIHVLEDLGYEVIDNLPFSLLPRLLDGPPIGRPLALGLDTRNRDFSVDGFLELRARLARDPALRVEVLYLDCRRDVLVRRYSETRRRHPLAGAEAPSIGIEREQELLVPIRAHADVLIDTSELTPHELAAEIRRFFDPSPEHGLSVSLHSFSYKRGIPRGMDLVFDVRFLRNPHWEPELRELTGLSPRVREHVSADPRHAEFFERVAELVDFLLPAYREEGKSHLSIGFGCTGGRHRSVTLAEQLANRLEKAGWQVSIRHRELERRMGAAPDTSG
ncbi:UPF0042 nucleotide-binding protein [Meinhardsimonia xiamenensis]|jgi:UPF0042 nucleotide-binding protein|uniref:UPF0042 nucleotide-binding protein n=1 Tax=Meinhardsimonia xiamenensis TaxID=990712 RepID=A0A1G8ZHK6_9RHOB|nr:RNase adapter RapZ [Meinhardsimonia xiamenensis]PRX37717.1 UPF0042 nucleotide-binding protein [Meinhardsimonia xiamenensis]SDK14541.1 UPF0042 nucleotide-binding protein [Meinhardsimonia xiamenensis]